MELLSDPQTWLSLVTLAALEIVLGIDNIIFLVVLVDRLPQAQRKSARLLGLGFAMLTRIGLLFTITWLATLRTPLFSVLVIVVVSPTISRFVDRFPTIKVLALAFLILVGVALIGESLDWEIPKGYLYFAMAFSVVVEWLNIRLRRRG